MSLVGFTQKFSIEFHVNSVSLRRQFYFDLLLLFEFPVFELAGVELSSDVFPDIHLNKFSLNTNRPAAL
jgi:hypothetical protein